MEGEPVQIVLTHDEAAAHGIAPSTRPVPEDVNVRPTRLSIWTQRRRQRTEDGKQFVRDQLLFADDDADNEANDVEASDIDEVSEEDDDGEEVGGSSGCGRNPFILSLFSVSRNTKSRSRKHKRSSRSHSPMPRRPASFASSSTYVYTSDNDMPPAPITPTIQTSSVCINAPAPHLSRSPLLHRTRSHRMRLDSISNSPAMSSPDHSPSSRSPSPLPQAPRARRIRLDSGSQLGLSPPAAMSASPSPLPSPPHTTRIRLPSNSD